MTSKEEVETHVELKELIADEDYKGALKILKRNPLMHISDEEARSLLNNLEAIDPKSEDPEADQKQVSLHSPAALSTRTEYFLL
jgi:hypothetical protein